MIIMVYPFISVLWYNCSLCYIKRSCIFRIFPIEYFFKQNKWGTSDEAHTWHKWVWKANDVTKAYRRTKQRSTIIYIGLSNPPYPYTWNSGGIAIIYFLFFSGDKLLLTNQDQTAKTNCSREVNLYLPLIIWLVK